MSTYSNRLQPALQNRRLRFSSDADIVRLTNARIIIIIIITCCSVVPPEKITRKASDAAENLQL